MSRTDPVEVGDTGVALTSEQRDRVVQIAMDLARQGHTDELVEFIDHGLAVDVLDHEGNSLLMMAAYHGRAATVAALVSRGADVNLRNARDQAPLAGAMFKGEDEVARLLIDAGADLDSGTPTARQAAQIFGRTHLIG